MQRVRYLIVPLLLVLAVGCSRDPKTQAARLVESGNKFFDRGKFKEASMQYKRAAMKDPKNADAYYKLGLSSLKLGDLPTAAQSLRRAVDTKPDNTDAATKLADIYWLAYASDSRKFKNILSEIEELDGKLLARDPKSFDGLRFAGYLLLAKVQTDSKSPEESKAWLDKALAKFKAANQVKPYQPEMSTVMVQTLLATGQREEAEQFAKDFIEHNKTFTPMYDQLLMFYIARKQYDEGEKLLKTKLDNNSKQEASYLQLAAFYHGLKRTSDEESTLQKMLAQPKDFPMAHLSIGRYFYRFRDTDRAKREYEAGMQAGTKDKASYQKALIELLASRGKTQEAKALVDEVLKDNPKDPQALEMRSSLQLMTGNPAEIQAAVTELQALVTKNPENPIYRFELGNALMVKKAPDQARVHLEEAIRLRPDFAQPKLVLSQILTGKQEFAKALQLADDVIRALPDNITAHLIRSQCLIGIGQRDKAKLELDAILKNQPNSADAKFQLGMLNFSEGKYKEADGIFRQMQDQGDNRGLIGVVETQVAQKDFADAVTTMQGQLTKDPNRQDYRLALANIQVRAEKFDDAIANFKVLIDKNPKAADLYTRLGETERLKGDLNGSIAHFKTAINLAPNDITPMIRLALLLDGTGRRSEAKPLYEKILNIKQDDPVALNNLAFIKAEEGSELDQALSLAQRAKQALPQDPNITDTLGWVYIKKNLSEDAVKVFKDLVTKEPRNATYRYHFAMALYQKGDRPNAKKECETALQSNPSKEDAGKIRELMQKIG